MTAVEPRPLRCKIEDRSGLAAAYMPFIADGGLFISHVSGVEMGAEIPVLLYLLENPEPVSLWGRVVWITPESINHGQDGGVGVQFMGEHRKLKSHIENLLASLPAQSLGTSTL